MGFCVLVSLFVETLFLGASALASYISAFCVLEFALCISLLFFYDTSISLPLLLLLDYCFFLELTSALPCRAEGSSSYQLTPILAGPTFALNIPSSQRYLLYPRHLANVPHARLIPESSVDMAATDVALGALYIKFS